MSFEHVTPALWGEVGLYRGLFEHVTMGGGGRFILGTVNSLHQGG